MSNLHRNYITQNFIFIFFFFLIIKRLFPKGKPHNQRIHKPKAQKKRKRTEPPLKLRRRQQPETTTNNQGQQNKKPNTLPQPGKIHHTQMPSPQPGQRQPRPNRDQDPTSNKTINQPNETPWPRILRGKDHLSHIALFTGPSLNLTSLQMR